VVEGDRGCPLADGSGRGGRERAPRHGLPDAPESEDPQHLLAPVPTPRDVLAAIPGLRLVEMERPDRCCGSAGLYNLVHARVADMLLERKIVRLQESGGGTTLNYDMDAQVGGRIAGVGQRLVDSSARVITQQGLEGLERQLQARSGASDGDEPAPVPAPTQQEFATGFAKGLFAELVPPERRPFLLGTGAAILLGLAILLFRSCG